ncbi:hypothetical protein Trydic_g15024 [Trypoxylus dichotomus]
MQKNMWTEPSLVSYSITFSMFILRSCEPQHIKQELQHLNQALQANGYRNPQIKSAMRPSNSKRTANEHQLSIHWQDAAYLAYIKSVTDRIGRALERHNIKTIHKPTQQLRHQLRSVKDPRDPLTSTRVYRISCSCGLVYIGITKRGINTRLKEYKRNCRLRQPDKASVAEHVLQNGHHNINFANTEGLSTVSHYGTRLQRETVEIYKHPGNFNRKEENLAINQIWYTVLRIAPVTRTANRTDQRRIYNGCMLDNESFNAEPPKRYYDPPTSGQPRKNVAYSSGKAAAARGSSLGSGSRFNRVVRAIAWLVGCPGWWNVCSQLPLIVTFSDSHSLVAFAPLCLESELESNVCVFYITNEVDLESRALERHPDGHLAARIHANLSRDFQLSEPKASDCAENSGKMRRRRSCREKCRQLFRGRRRKRPNALQLETSTSIPLTPTILNLCENGVSNRIIIAQQTDDPKKETERKREKRKECTPKETGGNANAVSISSQFVSSLMTRSRGDRRNIWDGYVQRFVVKRQLWPVYAHLYNTWDFVRPERRACIV